MHKLQHILAGLLLAGAAILAGSAHADEMVVRDRFSDQIVGEGPDLVFIPGLASSRDTWKATAERLKAHYRLHLIQVAGFAGEPARANAQGPVLVPTAEAIDAYLIKQHLAPATVIGHSMGGTILLYLAEHHGGDLKKGLIVDSLPFYGTLMFGPDATVEQSKTIADKIRATTAPMSDAQRTKMLSRMAVAPSDKDVIAGWSKASDLAVVNNAFADDITLDIRPGLADISVPLTLIYPDYVPLGAPKGNSDAMYHGAYAAAKSLTFVRADNSLHFVMFDQPAQFNAALDAFLAQ